MSSTYLTNLWDLQPPFGLRHLRCRDLDLDVSRGIRHGSGHGASSQSENDVKFVFLSSKLIVLLSIKPKIFL